MRLSPTVVVCILSYVLRSVSAAVCKHMVCKGMVVVRTAPVSINATFREINHFKHQHHSITITIKQVVHNTEGWNSVQVGERADLWLKRVEFSLPLNASTYMYFKVGS